VVILANVGLVTYVQVIFTLLGLTCRALGIEVERSRSLYAIARPSVACRLSVTLVRPTQAVQIFGNVSTAFGTLVIH